LQLVRVDTWPLNFTAVTFGESPIPPPLICRARHERPGCRLAEKRNESAAASDLHHSAKAALMLHRFVGTKADIKLSLRC
jgi:hypothetical protein